MQMVETESSDYILMSSRWNLDSTWHRPGRYRAARCTGFLHHQVKLQMPLSVKKVSLLLRRPIFDIMLSLSLYSPKKELSCFSRPDNYFSLIPACQGQSQPSIEAGDRTTSHHLSPSPFFSISLPLSVSLCLTLRLQDPSPSPPPAPQSVVVSLSLSSSVSSLRIDLHWENSDSAGQKWLSEE